MVYSALIFWLSSFSLHCLRVRLTSAAEYCVPGTGCCNDGVGYCDGAGVGVGGIDGGYGMGGVGVDGGYGIGVAYGG